MKDSMVSGFVKNIGKEGEKRDHIKIGGKMTDERYIIKYGRFGAYFYDNKLEKDIDLKEALIMLNEWSKLMRLGDVLEGYER